MKIRITSIRRRSSKTPRLGGFAIALLLGCGWAGNVFADGNPDIVGVLATITDPRTAADLGLSEVQLDRLRGLIKQHESKALEFASELRTLEAGERRLRSKEILRGVETAGMALLNDQQRSRAEQLRLQGLGVASLLEPDVATAIAATPAQVAKVQTIVEGKRGILREFGPEKGEMEFKRQLSEVLDDTQKAKWTEMTGAAAKAAAGDASENSDAVTSPSDQLAPKTITNPAGDNPAGIGLASPALADGAPMPQLLPGEMGLRLNFNSVPWSDVLKWLAKEAELSLQTDFYPPGTFTYRDPYRVYTVAEAMDIMNYVLLNRGYTLIRRQRALMCVDLGAGENADVTRGLIREMTELVPPKELESRGEYEIFKTVFNLTRMSVEDAEKEIKPLLGPQGSIVPLAAANQLVVTETGSKLRIIRDTLERSEMPDAGRTSKIVTIHLEHMGADELLGIARPLLGLKDMNNVADDLSISTDAFGTTLYATGTPDKLQKLRDIVTQVDIEATGNAATTSTAEKAVVRSHAPRGSDPQTTMNVLQTHFAGQTNIILDLDPKSNNIIAQATPTDHETIEQLISTLAGETSGFEVIELENLDTQAAILTLEKFFGKQSTKDKEAGTAKGPIFYGDTVSRRIMIKGTKQEVEQVQQLLRKVQSTGPALDGLRNNTRFLPYSGKSADRLLDQIDLLWEATKHKGRIRKIEPKEPPKASPGSTEGSNGDTDQAQPEAIKGSAATSAKNTPAMKNAQPTSRTPVAIDRPAGDRGMTSHSAATFGAAPATDLPRSAVRLTKAEQPQDPADETAPNQDATSTSSEPEVKIYQGPTGLIVTSDNPELLNEFDEIARLVQEQMASGPSEPTVIYLKYIPALAAEELIRGVLAGGTGSSSSGGGGGLLGEVASGVLGGGGFLGSLLGMGGGGGSAATSSVTASGDVYITADPRNNALWIQANPLDMQLIEQLVELVDTPGSPVDVQTRGVPNIIYLETASVEQVEATVKSVFADRLSSTASQASQRQPSPQEFIEALRGGGGGGGGRRSGPKELKETTMTITADKKNNALIVLAPKQLFEEVEALVKMLDQAAEGSEDSMVVVPIGGDINPTTIRSALSSVFGTQARTSSTSTPSTPSTPPATGGQPQANAFQGFRGFNPAAFGGGGQGQRGGGFPGMGGGGGGFPGMGGGGFPGMGGGGQNFRGGQGGGNPFGGGANPFGGGGGGGGGNRGNRGNRGN
jgi:type II secretory pathway component GspD/PulD (secretin)